MLKRKLNNMLIINPISNSNINLKKIKKTEYFEATEILDNLYLGSYEDSKCEKELLDRNIGYILNISEECEKPNYKYNFIYKQIKIKDHSDEPINLHFEETSKFINDALNSNNGILVHCKMGISRSATIIIAYLMNYGFSILNPCKISYSEALKFVKSKRKYITPKLGFCLYLKELDIVNGFKTSIFDEDDDNSKNSTPCSY